MYVRSSMSGWVYAIVLVTKVRLARSRTHLEFSAVTGYDTRASVRSERVTGLVVRFAYNAVGNGNRYSQNMWRKKCMRGLEQYERGVL